MDKQLCKKCGSKILIVELLPEEHAQPARLTCSECGAWVKWCSFDQVRALWDKKLA